MPVRPDNPRSLRSGGLYNVLGSLVYSGCQWGVLIATVKLSTAADVGMLSLGFAVTAPVFLLLHLRLRSASATDAAFPFRLADYVWLRLLGTALACLVVMTICFCSGFGRQTVSIVLWVAAAKAVESGSDLLYGFMQQADDLRAIAISMCARGVLALALFAGILARTHRLDLALAGLCAGWAMVFVLVDLPWTLRNSTERLLSMPSVAALMTLTRLTLPLGLSTMFMSLMATMPRYFIQHSLGLRELAFFSAVGYLSMTASVIIGALAEASIAGMARAFAAGRRDQAAATLNKVLGATLALSAASIALSLLFGKPLLRFVYRAEYSESAVLLTALMVAASIANLSSVYGYALIAARRFKSYLGCLAMSCACTAAACALLIPRWGLGGAAGACIVGYGVQWMSSWWMLRADLVQDSAAITGVQAATIQL